MDFIQDTPEITTRRVRRTVLDMIYRAQSSHIGSNFSCIEILYAIFKRLNLTKDQFILSAGWKAATLYAFLAEKGVIPEEDLQTYCQEGSKYIGLTEPGIPGVLFAGGSMQMGVPAAVGFALAKKIQKEPGRIYCLMSDGEMAGGMIWEAAAIADHHQLDNLTVIVDENGLQAMGDTRDIINMDSVARKWRAFNWEVFEVDGHEVDEIDSVLAMKTNGPKLVLARTIKGKGVSFMEGKNEWHYKNIPEDLYQKAKLELNG